MAVHVQWDNPEQTILRQSFEGRWTWQEWQEADRKSLELANQVAHSIDLIADLRPSAALPAGFISHTPQLAAAAALNDPNFARVVVVGASQSYRVIGEFFLKAFPKAGARIEFFDDVERARAFLAESA